MDKISPRKDTSEEVTRESLIAISYSLPGKILASKLSDNSTGEKLGEVKDYDGADKYRSELIAISDSESPDVQGRPPALGELKG